MSRTFTGLVAAAVLALGLTAAGCSTLSAIPGGPATILRGVGAVANWGADFMDQPTHDLGSAMTSLGIPVEAPKAAPAFNPDGTVAK